MKGALALLFTATLAGCASVPTHDEAACASGVSTWRDRAFADEQEFSRCFSGQWAVAGQCDGDEVVGIEAHMIDGHPAPGGCSVRRAYRQVFGGGYRVELSCDTLIVHPPHSWTEYLSFARLGDQMTIIDEDGRRSELMRCAAEAGS